jgi:hypothetical protein
MYGQSVDESPAFVLILQYLWTRSSDLGHDGSTTGKGRSGESRHVHAGMSTPDFRVPRYREKLTISPSNSFPVFVVVVCGRGGKVPL